MSDDEIIRPLGKTTIAPEVLVSIVQLSAQNVKGVSRLSDLPKRMSRFLRKGTDEGVHIVVEDGLVYVDLHVILNRDVDVRKVGLDIQHHVARAISEMVGMGVGMVNVHIEDIDYFPED